jgi:hypothetical protein
MLFYFPTGQEIVDQLRDNSLRWQGQPHGKINVQTSDPGGAGEFMQSAQANSLEPLRYFGFAPANLRTRDQEGTNYQVNYKSSFYQRLINDARPIRLGLYNLQGYNPVQIARYVDFLVAINGVELNYHEAYITQDGISSPLLSLLHVTHVIVPHPIGKSPFARPAAQLVRGARLVYSNTLVDVIALPALPYATIVHEAEAMPKEQVLSALLIGTRDPATTAIVEKTPPALSAPAAGGSEQAQVTSYEPDEIRLTAKSTGDGILVLSEIYIPGWKAYVDGDEVEIFPVNYVQRGIALPAGDHVVTFRYDPISLKAGMWITGAMTVAAIAILGAAAYGEINRRRGRHPRGLSA